MTQVAVPMKILNYDFEFFMVPVSFFQTAVLSASPP